MSVGTAIIVLIVFYFIIKWAIKNGIKEAYQEIKNDDDKVVEALNALGDMCIKKSEKK